jgi:hypothetical protein
VPSWSSGPPTGYGGQASHDYSWFGFIDSLSQDFFAIYSMSNFNAKKDWLLKPIDFYGVI